MLSFTYRLLETLGSGAFGEVHRGIFIHSNNSEIEVAVKSLHREVTKEEQIKFLQEAVIMGQFSHPNIIKLLGIVLQDSVSYGDGQDTKLYEYDYF